MTIGKLRGLARLADAQGHFRMVALDQRPPIFELVAAARGIPREQVAFADVAAVKRALVEALSPHCSSMLFDPNFAVPAAIDLVPPRCGLVVTLEEHRTGEGPGGGRLSRAIADWSVAKIRAMGGDAVKLLAWYRPDADPSVLAHQQRFVRGVGEDCRRHDIAYVLELLVHPLAGGTADYQEDPGRLPALVIDSVREFARPEYGVDLMKLESPLPAHALPPRDGSAAARAAQAAFDAIGAICREAGLPWVLLSAGAPRESFERVLEYACAAGAGGFLAGRSIWRDAVRAHFPDLAGMKAALAGGGVDALRGFNELVGAQAASWRPAFPRFEAVAAEGDFARTYRPG